jgi:hypothetical protein
VTPPPPLLVRREVVELARKLILTSLLALVQPGSATQGAPRSTPRPHWHLHTHVCSLFA